MVTMEQVMGLSEIRVDTQNAGFPLSTFTEDEKRKWDAAFAELFWPKGGIVRNLYESRGPELLAAARAAKKSLKDKTFGGFSAANTEIGMSTIRPAHVGFTSNNTLGLPNNVWRFDFQAQTVTNWIGNSSSGFTVGGAGANTFIANIGLLELSPVPVADVVKLDIGRASILPIDTHALRVSDTPGISNVRLCPLPTTFWGPQEAVQVRIFSDNGGTCELAPLGYTYALGVTLNNITYNEAARTT